MGPADNDTARQTDPESFLRRRHREARERRGDPVGLRVAYNDPQGGWELDGGSQLLGGGDKPGHEYADVQRHGFR